MPVTNSVFNDRPVLRLCEYGTCTPSVALEPWQKDAVEDAALRWKEMHRLNRVPLRWEGKNGDTLRAAQYVGVVEAGGLAIEIYPKLDKAALSERIPKDGLHKTLLSNLLWMMEVAENVHPPETDSGSLDESPRFVHGVVRVVARSSAVCGTGSRSDSPLRFVRGRFAYGARSD